MNLVMDFGNTWQKMAIVDNNNYLEHITKKQVSIDDIAQWQQQYNIENAILSSVVDVEKTLLEYLQQHFQFIQLDSHTLLPIKNDYHTPQSLGSDRLAVVVGAKKLFPQENVLVLQLGTCLTADFIDTEGVYRGGAIAPGINMRLEAMHAFSAKLPQVAFRQIDDFVGKTTEESMLSGVYFGMIDQCDGIVDRYKVRYGHLQVILTGGDAPIMKNAMKNEVMAISDLVLLGLNEILDYYVKN
jgi:type III pantothenate kinase